MRTQGRQNGIHAAKPQIRAAARAVTKCWGQDCCVDVSQLLAGAAQVYQTREVALAMKLLSALPRRCIIWGASNRDFNKYVKSEETSRGYWERKYNGRGPLAGEWIR